MAHPYHGRLIPPRTRALRELERQRQAKAAFVKFCSDFAALVEVPVPAIEDGDDLTEQIYEAGRRKRIDVAGFMEGRVKETHWTDKARKLLHHLRRKVPKKYLFQVLEQRETGAPDLEVEMCLEFAEAWLRDFLGEEVKEDELVDLATCLLEYAFGPDHPLTVFRKMGIDMDDMAFSIPMWHRTALPQHHQGDMMRMPGGNYGMIVGQVATATETRNRERAAVIAEINQELDKMETELEEPKALAVRTPEELAKIVVEDQELQSQAQLGRTIRIMMTLFGGIAFFFTQSLVIIPMIMVAWVAAYALIDKKALEAKKEQLRLAAGTQDRGPK